MSALTDHEKKIVQEAASTLGEHFDSVQIFVTRHEASDGGTIRAIEGRGNWFARYGQVREWVIREEETSRVHAREDNKES